MNLANPTALLWIGLAIPIVVFYILKIRLRRVPVSTILFWRQIFEEKQPRSLWQHLRHLLSLCLQIVFLCLLILALAEPFFHWEVLDARRVVVVIDNSASMNATDVPPTRLARAKKEGQRIIDGLRFRDEIALVAAGTQPQVLCGLTAHRGTIQAALDAVSPTDGPTRVAEAVALGRRLLADQHNGKVIVLTDGCFEGANKLAGDDVELVAVGQRTGNVAITRFQVRRSLLDPTGYEILAEVVNHSDEPVECRLNIDLDGNAVEVVPLRLDANGVYCKVFENTSVQGGLLVARIDRPDALLADNEAQAILPKREEQPVTLVTEGNLFLEKVFEAGPLVKLTLAKELPGEPAARRVTVFHRKVPARLPPGPVLVIDPAGSCDLWQIGEPLQNPIVAKQDRDSPLMAHVRLDNVILPEARRLTIADNLPFRVQVLASALAGEPLYATFERPEGKVAVLTVNLDKGDLPLRTAFPILTMNALSWFAGNRGEIREALATGTVTEVELPPGTNSADLQLWTPDRHGRKLPSNITKATIGPLDQCGIWSIGAQPAGAGTTDGLRFACNLANRAESDLRPPEGLAAEAPSLAASFGVRPIWFYLLVLAWLLAGLEWFLYQRRWIS
jgi:hypothetical protein